MKDNNLMLTSAQEIATAIENAGSEIASAIAGFSGTSNELKLGFEVYGTDFGHIMSLIAAALESIADSMEEQNGTR